jgi:hypothetical protein
VRRELLALADKHRGGDAAAFAKAYREALTRLGSGSHSSMRSQRSGEPPPSGRRRTEPFWSRFAAWPMLSPLLYVVSGAGVLRDEPPDCITVPVNIPHTHPRLKRSAYARIHNICVPINSVLYYEANGEIPKEADTRALCLWPNLFRPRLPTDSDREVA